MISQKSQVIPVHISALASKSCLLQVQSSDTRLQTLTAPSYLNTIYLVYSISLVAPTPKDLEKR